MKLISTKVLVVAVLSIIVVLALAGVALAAPPWSDATSTWWQAGYGGITDTQVATVADGYPDGTFRPSNSVTRGQFAKMAVSGLGVAPVDPAAATFMDVTKGSIFFTYVEGAHNQGLIAGYPLGGGLVFKPSNNITRQQTNSILGRYLSQAELNATGVIRGPGGLTYASLDLWYSAAGGFYLNGFTDADQVAAEHRAATAYLIFHGVVQGSDAKLSPTATLNRAQAAVMVLRVAEAAGDITTPPPAPTELTVTPISPGNDSTPQVSGIAIASSPVGLYDTFNGAMTLVTTTSTNAAGFFYADVTTALADGTHVFTAKVKNAGGMVSSLSLPVIYVLDTVAPTWVITAPLVPMGDPDAAVKLAKPVFTATAADERSGVRQVEFQVAKDETPPSWRSVSIDTAPSAGTNIYSADWPTTDSLAGGLADGQYVFRVIITDNAGNATTSASTKVTVDTTAPTAAIAAGSLVAQGTDGIFYSEDRKPQFGAIGSDVTGGAVGTLPSGVAKVEFLYAPITPAPGAWTSFALISSDAGASGFAAYPTAGIPDGSYLFAARVTDRAGNESVWNGAARQVVIDNAAPVVNITAPLTGALIPDATNYTITWTLTDVSAPSAVLIEYSPTGADGSWATIAAAAPFSPGFPGSYLWTTVPDISGADVTTYRVRITAVDKAGAPVGHAPAHTTAVTSGAFALYDAPLAASNVSGFDHDTTAGLDWRDFYATWSPSTSGHIASQRVYLLPSAQAPNLTTNPVDVPVATFSDNTTAVWNSTSALVADSRGAALAAVAYKIWVVSTDLAGRTATAQSANFTPVSD